MDPQLCFNILSDRLYKKKKTIINENGEEQEVDAEMCPCCLEKDLHNPKNIQKKEDYIREQQKKVFFSNNFLELTSSLPSNPEEMKDMKDLTLLGFVFKIQSIRLKVSLFLSFLYSPLSFSHSLSSPLDILILQWWAPASPLLWPYWYIPWSLRSHDRVF